MTTYATGNPLGSTNPKDLKDNAENFDKFANGPAASYPDRFGGQRKSIQGMNAEFEVDQAQRVVEFNHQLASSGYETPVDYAPGISITRTTQQVRYLGELYRPKDDAIPFTTTTFAADEAKWISNGDNSLRQELAADDGATLLGAKKPFVGAKDQTQYDINKIKISVSDFAGADPTGVALQDSVFVAAENENAGPIFVPDGDWRLSTPQALGENASYYGPGVLKFDRAEWWRRGGSAGGTDPERYTILYEFDSQSDAYILFDEVPQTILSWEGAFTFLAPTSTSSVSIKYGVYNGRLRLSNAPELPRSFNMLVGSKVTSSLDVPTGTPLGYNNTSHGSRALLNLTTGTNNTAHGSRALASITDSINNTAMGFQALYRATAYSGSNTAVGSTALEWLKTGVNNTGVGGGVMGRLETGNHNSAFGLGALSDQRAGDYNTAIGFSAQGNNSTATGPSECTSIGAYANRYMRGSQNTAVGYRCLNGIADQTGGLANTAVGFFAGRDITTGTGNALLGTSAGLSVAGGSYNTLVGYEAGNTVISSNIVAVGYQALRANGSAIRSTAVGNLALALSTGNDNTALGFAAGEKTTTGSANIHVGVFAGQSNTVGSNNVDIGRSAGSSRTASSGSTNIGHQTGQFLTGSDNTNIGANAGRLAQDGTNAVLFTNSMCLGTTSAVSGSNQNQIGNSSTTTYVYGTVQNRSDANDKADVQDTNLGLDFVMGLRPVEGRWDMREDYFEEVEVEVLIDEEYPTAILGLDASPLVATRQVRETQIERRPIPKDGSKKRTRFHQWFLAQEVKELCDSLGVDFGGYQDHSIQGGCDVLSLGYDEFIPPIIKALQDVKLSMDQRFAALEDRLAALEDRIAA